MYVCEFAKKEGRGDARGWGRIFVRCKGRGRYAANMYARRIHMEYAWHMYVGDVSFIIPSQRVVCIYVLCHAQQAVWCFRLDSRFYNKSSHLIHVHTKHRSFFLCCCATAERRICFCCRVPYSLLGVLIRLKLDTTTCTAEHSRAHNPPFFLKVNKELKFPYVVVLLFHNTRYVRPSVCFRT